MGRCATVRFGARLHQSAIKHGHQPGLLGRLDEAAEMLPEPAILDGETFLT